MSARGFSIGVWLFLTSSIDDWTCSGVHIPTQHQGWRLRALCKIRLGTHTKAEDIWFEDMDLIHIVYIPREDRARVWIKAYGYKSTWPCASVSCIYLGLGLKWVGSAIIGGAHWSMMPVAVRNIYVYGEKRGIQSQILILIWLYGAPSLEYEEHKFWHAYLSMQCRDSNGASQGQ